ncbi:MAG: DUF3391 domain-containing protein [Agarilytica sp.]
MNTHAVNSKKKEHEERSRKIHVSKLQLGMYVAKLDREWLDTPFLMQGFLIESQDDIEILTEFCQFVWIDAVFEECTKPEVKPISDEGSSYTVRYINKLPPQEEHRAALNIYKGSRSKTKSMLDEIRLGGVVHSDQAKATVNDCVNSILRNANALMWMAKVRSQDAHTAEHCLNVCVLAISFGRHLGLDEYELHHLGLCGLLHDVGKMRIDPALLYKRKGFTEREERILKAHPIYGRNLLLASHGIYHGAIDVCYSHHERVDGTGYPRGIKGSGISQFTKMISIVDHYDDLTANRFPEESVTCTEALRDMYNKRGTYFDEKLALEFIRAIGLYPTGSLVELKNGMVGFVTESNTKHHHLPKVAVILNKDKQKLERTTVINLARIQKGDLSRSFMIKSAHKDGAFDLSISDYSESFSENKLCRKVVQPSK